ncbi:ABC transporter substrate-binding protein [uncultured Aeromicrobium sp.]|uniref:ABC transporter substrate-binding protein n=1 Tax=uncultured Aeromicrobium sp. TaxID=337820 RepID=UPI0025FEDFD9|nr:ABC transporter substrate-binding protein [uncultured Aeromicrobium sp.]
MTHRPRRYTTFTTLALTVIATSLAGCSRDAVPDSEASGATYTVEHVMGETQIPVDYERVVVTFPAFIDSTVAVGVTPAAAPVSSLESFPEYFGVDPDDIGDLGAYDDGIDLEVISEFEPDLILFNSPAGRDLDHDTFEALSTIAPAVPIVTAEQNFHRVATQIGVALNREEAMAQVAEDYRARAAEVRAAIADVPEAAKPVSQLRLYPDHARVMMEATNAGRVMTDAGLTFEPPIAGAELTGGASAIDDFYYEVSLELLPDALGEHVFVYSTDGAATLDEVRSLAIWQEIPAVQAGTVHEVDYETWMRGQGYRAAMSILDDIADAYGVTAG